MDIADQVLNGVIDRDPVESTLEAMKRFEDLCTPLIATNISIHMKRQNTLMFSNTCSLCDVIVETPKNGCCELLKDFEMM